MNFLYLLRVKISRSINDDFGSLNFVIDAVLDFLVTNVLTLHVKFREDWLLIVPSIATFSIAHDIFM